MSVEGFALQAGSYSAEALRRATTGILLERGSSIGSVVGGLVAATDLQTKAGTGMNVETSPGECVVNQGYSTSGGPNYIRLTSTLTSKVPAASPTLPRVDLLCAQVNDAAYHGSTNEYAISYLEGIPTAGATLANKGGAPILPTSALVLAYILVPANATSVLNENIGNQGTVIRTQVASVSSSQITSGAVTGPKVATEALTGDKLASAKTPYVEKSNILESEEVEVSSTRPAIVTVSVSGAVGSLAEFKIGSFFLGSVGLSSMSSFVVPAGQKWHWTTVAGSEKPGNVRASYWIL